MKIKLQRVLSSRSFKTGLWVVLMSALAIWLFTTNSYAQTPSPVCGKALDISLVAVPESMKDVAWGDLFREMIYGIQGGGRCMAGIFIEEGADLATFFVGLSLTLLVPMYLIDAGEPLKAANIVVLLAKAAVITVALGSWSGGMSSGTNVPSWLPTSSVTVEDVLVKPFDELNQKVFAKYNQMAGGKGDAKTDVFNSLGGAWGSLWNANEERGKVRDAVRSKISNPLIWIQSWIESIGDAVGSFVWACAILFILGLMMASYVFVLYFGDVAVIIGMICGPLMLPGYLFKPFAWLGEAWLKFMISAGFYKIIAAVIAIMTLGSISVVQTVSNTMYLKYHTLSRDVLSGAADGAAMVGGMMLGNILMFLFALFGLFLMWKVEGLTTALMRGFGGQGAGNVVSAGTQAVSNATTSIQNAASGNNSKLGTFGGMALGSVGAAVGNSLSGAAHSTAQNMGAPKSKR